MRKLILDILVVNMMLGVAVIALASPSNAQNVITEIIDATGDGGGNLFGRGHGIAVDGAGNVYVASRLHDNAFKITPGGVITEIIDATGDGGGNILDAPQGIAVDGSGNVYVAGQFSDNAFKIEPVPPPVPALSNRGLVILAASLVCAALWLARRQRMANA